MERAAGRRIGRIGYFTPGRADLITHDLGVLSSVADRVSIFYAGRVVESGAREDVLQRPRHPYTRALLDALPHPEAAKEQELVAIKGTPPSPGRIPPGCAFHPRCPYAQDRCRVELPVLREIAPAHWSACHRSAELSLRGVA